MAVVRVEKTKNYTVMSNAHLDDPRLSLRAIGLLSKMLRLPDDWDYTVRGLAAMCREGRDAVERALNELIEAGYVVRTRTRKADGSFGGVEYVVYESAGEHPDGVPRPGNPDTENPDTENPPQPSTIKNQVLNIPPIVPPQGGRARRKRGEARKAPDWEPESFARLWSLYPKQGQKDKQRAMDAWDKLCPSAELIDRIERAISSEKKTELWARGIGIPYFCRYLSGQRWEEAEADAPEAAAPAARRYVRTDIVDGREVDVYE